MEAVRADPKDSVASPRGPPYGCPECRAILQHVNGCTRCTECGYSQCGWLPTARAGSSGNGL